MFWLARRARVLALSAQPDPKPNHLGPNAAFRIHRKIQLWHEDPRMIKIWHSGTRGKDTTPEEAPRVTKNSKSLEKTLEAVFPPTAFVTVFGPFHLNS